MTEVLGARLIAGAGGIVASGLLATVAMDVRADEGYRELRRAGRPILYVLWHAHLLPLMHLHRRQGVVTLVSRSQDGEYIARLLRQWGYETVRGSSSRGGGPALRRLVRLGRDGRSIAITPDGPRGPRERVKPGAVRAAQLTGLPVVGVAVAMDDAWEFRSWDRFLVPKPFSRVRVAYGPPYWIPASDPGDAVALRKERDRMDAALRAAAVRARAGESAPARNR